MEPEQVERLLLSSLERPEQLVTLRQTYNLTKNHFPFYPEEAEFIWNYITEYSDPPSASLLEVKFPDFDLAPRQDFDFIAKAYSDVSLSRSANIVFYKAQELLEDAPREAYPFVLSSLQNLMQIEDSHHVVMDAKKVEDKLEAYRARRNGVAEKNRFLSGIEELDEFPLTFRRGQMVGILADTKAGKSWFALKMATSIYLQGHKVTVLSPELSMEELEMRSDVVIARQMGFDLSYQGLDVGQASLEEEYEKFVQAWSEKDRKDWKVMNTGLSGELTPAEIANIVAQDRPDVLVIDGIYQLASASKGLQSWEKIKEQSNALKLLAVNQDICIIVTNQSNREGPQFGPPEARHTAYGYDFTRYIDVLISIGRNERSDMVRELSVPLRRSGKEIDSAFSVAFDPDKGIIGTKAPSDFEVPAFDDFE